MTGNRRWKANFVRELPALPWKIGTIVPTWNFFSSGQLLRGPAAAKQRKWRNKGAEIDDGDYCAERGGEKGTFRNGEMISRRLRIAMHVDDRFFLLKIEIPIA